MTKKILGFTVLAMVSLSILAIFPSHAGANKLHVISLTQQPFTPLSQITTTTYLPIIYTPPAEPYPFGVSAQDIALQLSDMPFGYTIDSDNTGPVETIRAIEGYDVQFENFDIILSGIFVVFNSTGVYSTPTLAANEIALAYQEVPADPDFNFEPVSVPVFGNETIAFKAIYEDELADFVIYAIKYRYGNLVSLVFTISILGVTTIEDTLFFVELSLNRIKGQTTIK